MSFWYYKSIWSYLLYPLHWLLMFPVWLRRQLYRMGWLSSRQSKVPVIVVGNIMVGGTGKSPIVASLVQEFKRLGLRPAIISRGYGGQSASYPLEVTARTDVSICGDEAWMLAVRCHCPVVVDPLRTRAAQLLTISQQCDVIISDDGLQHYAMQRQFEIAVVEGQRYLGNGLLMPLGPLREPAGRLKSVDAVVINHRFDSYTERSSILREKGYRVYDCHFSAQNFRRLYPSQSSLSLQAFVSEYQHRQVHAVAGIGNPEAFFDFLRNLGLMVQTHIFEDHHEFTEQDLAFGDGVIIMTEKDASKCTDFELADAWYLAIETHIVPNLMEHILAKVELEIPQ